MSGMLSMPTSCCNMADLFYEGFFTMGIGRLFLVERLTSSKVAAVVTR
jgi:hypothetical protein